MSDDTNKDTTTEPAKSGAPRWKLSCKVNGEGVEIEVDPMLSAYDILRDELGLIGTKGACLEGECGSCTIILDGKPVTSCLVLAPQLEGREVTTIEGLAADERLHPVQESFITAGAVQCGYCTPGLVVAAAALLEQNPNPTEDEVRAGLEGNLCRCTGYSKIVDAVLGAAKKAESKAVVGG